MKAQVLKSPLRYPGGKSRGAAQIKRYFPRKLKELVSPFIGGGSIELQVANSASSRQEEQILLLRKRGEIARVFNSVGRFKEWLDRRLQSLLV